MSATSRPGRLLAAALLVVLALGAAFWIATEGDRDTGGPRTTSAADAPKHATEDARRAALTSPDELSHAEPEASARAAAAPDADAPRAAADRELRPTSTGTLVLRGVVRDDRGEPCTRFRIRVRPPAVDGRRIAAPGKPIRGDFEASDGAYELDGLSPGPWEVRAENGRLASIAHAVELVNGVTTLDLVLPRAARIAGTVVDPSGAPVPGAKVDLIRDDTLRCPFDSQAPRRIECDTEGRFELAELAPCTLLLEACSEAFATSTRTRVELAPGEARSDLRLALRPAARITGIALDAQGKPDVGRRVMVSGPSRPCSVSLTPITTDEEGRFEVAGLAPGASWIHRIVNEAEQQAAFASPEAMRELHQLREGTHIELAEGETKHVVLGGRLSVGVRLWGVVAGAGRCGRPMFVNAYPARQQKTYKRLFAPVDLEGRYELVLDEAGAYELTVDTTAGTLAARNEVVPGEPDFRANFDLGTASIRGRVLGADGAPAANVSVYPKLVRASEDPTRAGADRGRAARSGADGIFVFDCLLPGTYELAAKRNDEKPEHAGEAPEVRHDTLVLDPGAQIEGLVLRFSPAATLEIVLSGATEGGMRFHIAAVDDQGRGVPMSEVEPRQLVLIRRMRPGRFFLHARAGDLSSAWSGPFETSPGRTTRVELMIVRGARLGVEITGAVGEDEVYVEAVDDAKRVLAGAWTKRPEPDAGGDSGSRLADLVALPPGQYTLRAKDGQGRRASTQVEIDSDQPRTVQLRMPE